MLDPWENRQLFTKEAKKMAKSARKRRARRKKSANHGKRPNA
jgi:hypothetical protein